MSDLIAFLTDRQVGVGGAGGGWEAQATRVACRRRAHALVPRLLGVPLLSLAQAPWQLNSPPILPHPLQGRQIDPRTFPEAVLNGGKLDLFHLYKWVYRCCTAASVLLVQ